MNKFILLTCLTIACTFLTAGTACAQSMDEARAAYAEGRFVEAAELARTLGTSEGHVLAADSLAIHGYYIAPEGEKAGLFRRGRGVRARGDPARRGQPAGPSPIGPRHGTPGAGERRT